MAPRLVDVIDGGAENEPSSHPVRRKSPNTRHLLSTMVRTGDNQMNGSDMKFSICHSSLVISVLIAGFVLADQPLSFTREVRLRDPLGQPQQLEAYRDGKLLVLAFLGTECPLAKLYAGRLQQLADTFEPQGVRFVGIHSNVQDLPAEIAAFARRHGICFPLLKDLGNQLADELHIERTPEVIVIDREARVSYRGRIDDQYLVGVTRDRPTSEELRMALDSLLAGQPAAIARTEPVGCLLGRAREPDETSEVTYGGQIARIFQRRCVACHRKGDIGPFELTSYEEAAAWGEMIKEVVEQRRMPPWHASPEYGSFQNDASLTAEERQQVAAWVEHGCPRGSTDSLPPPPPFTDGWQLPRKPDEIIAMRDSPFEVPADAGPAGVPYQYFAVKTGFPQDRWIKAAEVQPGNKSVVHHIIVYAAPPNGRRRRDWIFLTAYVPGLRNQPLPAKAAKWIPAAATLIFEMHYTPVGSVQSDLSRLGLIYADPNEITHEVLTADITNDEFEIPPHAADVVVTATSRPLEHDDVRLLSLSPHMHLRGKSFRYEWVAPDGQREVLLDVPRYDFNWQTCYVLSEPRPLMRGSVLHCRATFDNSSANLANPDPERSVRWGEQSWDEMMIGFCDLIVPVAEDRRSAHQLVTAGPDVVGLFDLADEDGDRRVTRAESERHPHVREAFPAVDLDQNGNVDLPEALRALRTSPR